MAAAVAAPRAELEAASTMVAATLEARHAARAARETEMEQVEELEEPGGHSYNMPPESRCSGAPSSGAGAPPPNRMTPIVRVDPVTILQERENRRAGRIAHRIAELSALPVRPPGMAEDVKTKTELKALRLLNFQRSLRAEVVACTKQGLREAKATERLKKQQRVESERKKRARHSEYISAVLNHSREMQSWHKANIAKVQKINTAILAWHASAEREQKKEQEVGVMVVAEVEEEGLKGEEWREVEWLVTLQEGLGGATREDLEKLFTAAKERLAIGD